MHDLAGVLRIGAAAEAQRQREIAHGEILRHIDRDHFADALGARDGDQALHQHGAQAPTLPFVADRDGAFAAAAVGRAAVARDADFTLALRRGGGAC